MIARIATLNALGTAVPGMYRVTNGLMRSPITRPLLTRIGFAPERPLPTLAAQTFRTWVGSRQTSSSTNGGYPAPDTRPEVVFFDDTFTNYNTPSIGQAAVKVLEAAGYRVQLVPKGCCGRPAISKGLLDEAKAMARHNLKILAPYVQRGVPIVGCEPSCMSALIDDYRDLVPGADADVVATASHGIEEFLVSLAAAGKLNLPFDNQPRQILFHAHCHQKASTTSAPVKKMLSLIPNATISEIASGCCGVAGSFGYEREHYDLSIKIAQDRLIPAITQSGQQTIIAASGTSCREQIEHNTDRTPLHPIEILAGALTKS